MLYKHDVLFCFLLCFPKDKQPRISIPIWVVFILFVIVEIWMRVKIISKKSKISILDTISYILQFYMFMVSCSIASNNWSLFGFAVALSSKWKKLKEPKIKLLIAPEIQVLNTIRRANWGRQRKGSQSIF